MLAFYSFFRDLLFSILCIVILFAWHLDTKRQNDEYNVLFKNTLSVFVQNSQLKFAVKEREDALEEMAKHFRGGDEEVKQHHNDLKASNEAN